MNKEKAVEYFKNYLTYKEIGEKLSVGKSRVMAVLKEKIPKEEFLAIKKKRSQFRFIWKATTKVKINDDILKEARLAKIKREELLKEKNG